MPDPIGSFSGLASGVQWRDLIDEMLRLETRRRIDPLEAQISRHRARASAWNNFSNLVSRLTGSLRALRDGTAFSAYSAFGGDSPVTGRALVTASASAGAAPASHRVEVLELARSEKLSGAVVASATDALGIDGEFWINGRRVELQATDSLEAVRDRINAVNTGEDPSGVSAGILSAGGGHRLVLTSAHAGSRGIELVDGEAAGGGARPLEQLGVLDGGQAANTGGPGRVETQRLTSMSMAIATALGVEPPPPVATIRVSGKVIVVDLETDSLASILQKIKMAGGDAELVEERVGGRTYHRLSVHGGVEAEGGSPEELAASQRVIELLGFVRGGRGADAHALVTGRTLAADGDGTPATGATLLTDLWSGGQAAGVQAGDTFTIEGSRGDGTTVTMTYTVAAGDTLDDLLAFLNDVETGFGAGARPAVATLADGRIRLVDSVGGDSQLSLSIVANNEQGGTLSFGATQVETVGRARELVRGDDARLRVDGVLVTRRSNTVSDVIAGVTLTLQHAEPGTEVDVTVRRDADEAVRAVQGVVSAFNELVQYVRQQSAPGQSLASNGTLRHAMASLRNVLLSDVAGLADGALFKRGALVGVALTRNGALELDEARLRSMIETNLHDVRALFSRAGTASGAALSFIEAGGRVAPGRYDVEITAVATRAVHTGSGFSGTYAAPGGADRILVSDSSTGQTAEVELEDGDDLETIVDRLNLRFLQLGMAVTAEAADGELRISASGYGSQRSFNVAFEGDGDPGTQLGFAAGTYAGTDVEGTIDGHAATGSGQLLTGSEGPVDGLAVRYTGDAAGPAGEIAFVLGLAGTLARAADAISRTGDGLVAVQVDSADAAVRRLEERIERAEHQLEVRRRALVLQFTRMEAAIGRLSAQSQWLALQIQSLQSLRPDNRT